MDKGIYLFLSAWAGEIQQIFLLLLLFVLELEKLF